MTKVYYNENDRFASQWLRNLILAGHLPRGDVDDRSITEVRPNDLRGYTQCHFFAGIGGWALAVRLAGLPDDFGLWTGSCPCQPFSAAGKQKGQDDERHLWPVWYRLIRECKPSVVFGEQVSTAIAFGWLDEVAHDLEGEGYAVGAAVLPACSVGAPHKRDRRWFVADASEKTEGRRRICQSGESIQPAQGEPVGGGSCDSSVDNAIGEGLEGHAGNEQDRTRWSNSHGPTAETDTSWLECPDGKTRPVKSGIRLLDYAIPNRVGKLRGFGNAIVPTVAAEFIAAFVERQTWPSTPNTSACGCTQNRHWAQASRMHPASVSRA
jgi:DNA (cytosine-5)-methyltransferase 1